MYYILSNDRIVKSYPFKLQCIIWLFRHGWVCSGYGDFYDSNKYYFLINPSCPDAKVKIVKEDNLG